MKSQILASFVIAGLTLAGIAASFAAARRIAARPGLPVASVDRDFQRVVAEKETSQVTALYRVKNVGGSDLALGEVSTSCGCSVASIEPSVVAAGSTATVRVIGQPPGSGEKQVSVSIRTNDPKKSTLTLGLAMAGSMPMPYISRSTGSVQFGVLAGRPIPETLVVETCEKAGSPHWLGEPSCQLPGVLITGGFDEARPFAGEAEYRRYRYEVSLDPVPPPGPFSGEILLRSRDFEIVSRLPVRGSMPKPITITPPALIATLESGDETKSFRVVVTSNQAEPPLEILLDQDAKTSLEVRQLSRTTDRIIFEIRPTTGLGAGLRETLKFRTNHPKSPEIVLPVQLKISTGR